MSQKVIPQSNTYKQPKQTCHRFYDTCLGNIPFGAMIGLLLTFISFIFIHDGFSECQDVLVKYNAETTSWATYLYTLLSGICLLHISVLLHGISVCILETSRESHRITEVGCYECCKDKNTSCGQCCRTYQKCSQNTCQITWAILGTFLLLIFHVANIGTGVVSFLSTFFSYVFLQACHKYSEFINTNIHKAYSYLNEAKLYIGKADNATIQFLHSYNQWLD